MEYYGGEMSDLQMQRFQEKLLSDIIEFQKEFNEPYYVFVLKSEIQNPTDYFHFIIYELGKNRIILWGIYDKINREVHVDDGCIYSVMKIGSYHKLMMTKFVLVNSVVKNRITSLVREFMGKIIYPRNYHEYKMMKAYVEYSHTGNESILKLIEREDNMYRSDMYSKGKIIPSIFDIIDDNYDVLDQLENDVYNYERGINLSMKEFKRNEDINTFISDIYSYMSKHNIEQEYTEKCPPNIFKGRDFHIDDEFYSDLPYKYDIKRNNELEELL